MTMEVDLGQFRYIFLLESLYGRCTVSLETLEQSKWKVAYTAALISLCLLNLIMYIILQTVIDAPDPLGLQISKVCLWTMSLHALTMAIVDYKSKISSALNLQAIEKKLDSMGVPVPGLRMFNIIHSTVVFLNILSLGWSAILIMVISSGYLKLMGFVLSFQCVCATLMQGFTLITFLIKIVFIQRAINQEFSEINQNQQKSVGSSEGRPRRRRNRNIKNQTESKQRIKDLKILQGSLSYLERILRDIFSTQIVFYRFIVEIMGLVICLSFATEAKTNYAFVYYVRMAITFLVIVVLVVKVEEEKNKTIEIEEYYYTKKGNAEHRKIRKHQTLAKIHRGRGTFSCVFFDVNYDLWAAFFENSAFVVTSMIGYSEIINRELN